MANMFTMFMNLGLDSKYKEIILNNYLRTLFYLLWPVANLAFLIANIFNIIYCLKNNVYGQEKRKD